MQSSQKWVNLGLLGVAALLFMLFSRLFQLAWDLARWNFSPDWPVDPIHLLGFVAAVGVTVAVRVHPKANGFFNEVTLELSKVTWPERKETVTSAGVVILLVGIATLILFFIDFLWGTVTRGLFKY